MIRQVIRLLEDRQWHCVREIREKCGLCEGDFERVLGFLSCFELVVLDDLGKRARADPCLLELPV